MDIKQTTEVEILRIALHILASYIEKNTFGCDDMGSNGIVKYAIDEATEQLAIKKEMGMI